MVETNERSNKLALLRFLDEKKTGLQEEAAIVAKKLKEYEAEREA